MAEPRLSCLACLQPVGPDERGEMHRRCSRRLFGCPEVPELIVDPATLHLFGQKMAGRVSLSGLQRKLSLGWDKLTLTVTAESSAYILKLGGDDYPELAGNEHLSLHLARLAGHEVPEFALIRLSDGQLAFIVKRFDRTDDKRKLAMEDFCQLNGLLSAEKYTGSAELCARTVRSFTDEPGPDLLRLFRRFLLSWWIGNGDLHLKNLALLSRRPGRPALAPVYDLLSTRILIPDDPLALPVGGRTAKIQTGTWIGFAAYCGLPEKLALREIGKLVALAPAARELIASSLLSEPMKIAYADVVESRTRVLAA